MLFELLFLLAGRKAKDFKETERRIRTGDKVAFQCPLCNHLGTATETIDERKCGRGTAWQIEVREFACDACGKRFREEMLENDGSGLLQIKKVTCPFCQTVNPANRQSCIWCSKTI